MEEIDTLIREALAVNKAFLALGNEVLRVPGATIIRNRSVPGVRDANHVTSVTASSPGQIQELMKRVEVEFAGIPHRRFDLDFTTPPAFEEHLAELGYRRSEALVMLLESSLIGDHAPAEIQPITDEAGWAVYGSLRNLDAVEFAERTDETPGADVAAAMVQSRRAKSPPLQYWLASVDGTPRAYCASWVAAGGIGQIEDLFTHPDYRHRGMATALIHHCVEECRRSGAGAILIVADADDTPKDMYSAMGFRAVATKREYWRTAD